MMHYLELSFPLSRPGMEPDRCPDLLPLAQTCVRGLREAGKTVAFAESCTGGLLAKTLTDAAGASDVFQCGIVAYSEQIKQELLGVSEETLKRYSVVSAETAAEMAAGVREAGHADIGIGVTGVAGPGPDGHHPEGEIYLALAEESNIRVLRIPPKPRGRMRNRQLAAEQAFLMLSEIL